MHQSSPREIQGYRGPNRIIEGFKQPHNYDGPFDSAQHERIRQNYSTMIENVDRWLGTYVDTLKTRGDLDNTLIVCSSDHGEMLGDHSRWGKSIHYRSASAVPLIVSGPGIKPRGTVDAPAAILDLAATFVDYAGVTVPDDWDSLSLKGFLEGSSEFPREVALSGLNRFRMAFDGRYKLVRLGEDKIILYDLQEDPNEDHNIAADHEKIVKRLLPRLSS